MTDTTGGGGGGGNLRVEAELVLRDLTRQVREKFEGDNKKMARRVAAALNEIEREGKGIEKSLGRAAKVGASEFRAVEKELKASEKEAAKLRREVERFEQSSTRAFGGTAKSLKGIVSQAKVAAGVIATVFAGTAIQSASAYNVELARVGTLLDDTTKQLPQLRKEIDAVADAQGVDRAESARALYQAISAGAGQGAESVTLVSEAIDLQRVAVSDLSVAVDALTSVQNAYGRSAKDIPQSAGELFATVRFGKTTLDEFGGSLGAITPLASALDVPFSQIAGAIAAITQSGASASEAVTQVRASLKSTQLALGDINNELAKYDERIDLTTIGSEGLADTFELIRKAAGGTADGLQELLGGRIEAQLGILALTGEKNAQTFRDITAEVENAAGATEKAAAEFEKNIGVRATRAATSLKNALADAGTSALSLVFFLSDASDAIIDSFSGLGGDIRKELDLAEAAGDFSNLSREAQKALADIRASIGSGVNLVNDDFFAQVDALGDQEIEPLRIGIEVDRDSVRDLRAETDGIIQSLRDQSLSIDADTSSIQDTRRQIDDLLSAVPQGIDFGEVVVPVDADPRPFFAAIADVRSELQAFEGDFRSFDVAESLGRNFTDAIADLGDVGEAGGVLLIEGFSKSVNAQGATVFEPIVGSATEAAALAAEELARVVELIGSSDAASGVTSITSALERQAEVSTGQVRGIEEANAALIEQITHQSRVLALEAQLATGTEATRLAVESSAASQQAAIVAQLEGGKLSIDQANELLALTNQVTDARLRQVESETQVVRSAELLRDIQTQLLTAEERRIVAIHDRADAALDAAARDVQGGALTEEQYLATKDAIEESTLALIDQARAAEEASGSSQLATTVELSDVLRQNAQIEAEITGEIEGQIAAINIGIDAQIAAAQAALTKVDAESLVADELREQVRLLGLLREEDIKRVKEGADPLARSMEQINRRTEDITSGAVLLRDAYGETSNLIADAARGTADLGKTFENVLDSIIAQLSQLLTADLFGGAGGGGGLLSFLGGFEHGGVVRGELKGLVPVDGYGPTPVRAHHGGGVVSKPTFALFGEGNQEEAFVPLQNGSIPVKIEGGRGRGGGGGPMHITIEGIHLASTSLDPRRAGDVILEQMPQIESRIADALASAANSSLTQGVRASSRGAL